jgi:RNA polymerase sigma-70 factor, ECF subfamily
VSPLDVELIAAERPRLVRLAYRMLGSVPEAEDVVQDALVRFQKHAQEEIEQPKAYLSRIVTRLCLDVLKSARKQRETYVGPWLPEPIFETVELENDRITLTLMLALERLSPLERAAFLLHDVFGVPLEEVAVSLGREPAACRKLASRAREHVRDARPRYPLSSEQSERIVDAFHAAARGGDLSALRTLLADHVVYHSDGGGKRSATMKPVIGRDRVERLLVGLSRKFDGAPLSYRHVSIDGLPGYISLGADRNPQTTALAVEGELVVAIYVVRNPDKLRRLPLALGESGKLVPRES